METAAIVIAVAAVLNALFGSGAIFGKKSKAEKPDCTAQAFSTAQAAGTFEQKAKECGLKY